ncbi:MAG: hypothetical protein HN931_02385 [Desulfobacterales bacterium]|jgi:hypothetical protein|nr:hypothetical protein [Desulfobacteraceae bacterium]MBT4364446.1 hypothetical protein [Desulfobacteraceae bacterium]MBT7085004.1 hypothetical protein [Desulfobacterales bacterium]
MEEKLIKKINLENSLEVEFFDASKKLMPDRWYICLILKMNIPVEDSIRSSGDIPDEDIKNIIDAIGNNLVFEQKREQNFVDEMVKEETLDKMCDSAIDITLAYLAHPEFAVKYIRKKYKEFVGKV